MAVTINASTSAGLVMTSDLSGQLQLQSNGVAITVPTTAGTMLVGGTPSASVLSTVTNKIAVNIGGTTYYLLASTSGT